jgi:hypothetical protein
VEFVMNLSFSSQSNLIPQPPSNGSTRSLQSGSDQPVQGESIVSAAASEALPTEAATSEPVQWGLLKRLSFRFAFVYLALFMLPFVLIFPGHFFSGWPTVFWQPYAKGSQAVVTWVGAHVFQVELASRFGARGDITADYIQHFCYLVLAAAATLMWSLVDWKRTNYTRLLAWLRLGVCYYLAAQMILYGACKVIPNQFFGSTSPAALTMMVGNLDRMGLLWTFMDASPAYTIFTGAAEMLGGLLLCFRRTRLLGALVCIGVMANVVMLNFCYDVCVKVNSSHFLAMGFFVAAADLRRLVDFFILGRTPQMADHRPMFAAQWLNRGVQIIKLAVVLGFVGASLHDNVVQAQTIGYLAPKGPLHGIWVVKEMVADGVVQPPLVSDHRYWMRAIFNPGIPDFYPATLSITRLNHTRQTYLVNLNTEQRTVVLTKFDDPTWMAMLTYSEPASHALVLEGTLDGRQVRITCQGVDESRLPINRPMRLISDLR